MSNSPASNIQRQRSAKKVAESVLDNLVGFGALLIVLFWLSILLGCDEGAFTQGPEVTPPAQTGAQVYAFTAKYCEQCHKDEWTVTQISWRVDTTVIDVDADPETAAAWGATELPLYVVVFNGNEVYRTHDVGELKDWLISHKDRQ